MAGALIQIDSRYCVTVSLFVQYIDFSRCQIFKVNPYNEIRFFRMAILTRSGKRLILSLAMMLYLWDSTVSGLIHS